MPENSSLGIGYSDGSSAGIAAVLAPATYDDTTHENPRNVQYRYQTMTLSADWTSCGENPSSSTPFPPSFQANFTSGIMAFDALELTPADSTSTGANIIATITASSGANGKCFQLQCSASDFVPENQYGNVADMSLPITVDVGNEDVLVFGTLSVSENSVVAECSTNIYGTVSSYFTASNFISQSPLYTCRSRVTAFQGIAAALAYTLTAHKFAQGSWVALRYLYQKVGQK